MELAVSLFEEIVQEDERLYFVQMAKQWLASEDHSLSALMLDPKLESERLATLTADLPLPEAELPKRRGKEMEMVIVDFSDSFCRSDHHELGGVNRPINGIYYLSVDNMEIKLPRLIKNPGSRLMEIM